jgi:predicted nuclease with TOPRIM domain
MLETKGGSIVAYSMQEMLRRADAYNRLQSEHKQLKEDFDTAYKELEWERKRSDELQEQLDKKDEQIIKFVKAEARVQARLKGQRDRAERKVHRLGAQLKECVDMLGEISKVESYAGMINKQYEAKDLYNKLKRGG